MLLQIQDPKKKTIKNTDIQGICGIDLGTTNSLIAVFKDGKPLILQDKNKRALLPSIVSVDANSIVVGDRKSKQKDAVVFRSMKRFIGKNLDGVSQTLYKVDYAKEHEVFFKTPQGEYSAVDISTCILKALKQRFEQAMNQTLTHAVITVPAHFNHIQREQTHTAASNCGIEVLRLINEPTAAAIACGLGEKISQNYRVVLDLGGGTFDVTLLFQDGKQFLVQATGGDNYLGGDDFDQCILNDVYENLNVNAQSAGGVLNTNELMLNIQAAREQLSTQDRVNLEIPYTHQPKTTIHLTQAHFTKLVQPLLKKIQTTCLTLLADANLEPDEIDAVILVGGATRMPIIQEWAQRIFQQTPQTHFDPDLMVAQGAATCAHQMAVDSQHFLLVDVLPLSLGLETMGQLVDKIIHRNSPLPVKKVKQFTTFADQQTALSIHVLQGEREMVQDCHSIGRFSLKNLPAQPAGLVKVDVSFEVDRSGILTVEAYVVGDEKTFSSMQFKVEQSSDNIHAILEDAMKNGEYDLQKRQLAQLQLEAQQVTASTEKMTSRYPQLLTAKQKQRIEDALNHLQDTRVLKDAKRLKDALATLETTTDAFAKKCMEDGFSAILSNQSIDDIK